MCGMGHRGTGCSVKVSTSTTFPVGKFSANSFGTEVTFPLVLLPGARISHTEWGNISTDTLIKQSHEF